LAFVFLFKAINALKRQLKPEKRIQAAKRGRLNLTTSSDRDENKKYFFTSSKYFSTSKTNLAKSSHPTTNH
jgi:hypothetical protein